MRLCPYVVALAVALAATLAPGGAESQVFLSQEEALGLAFPGGEEVTRETAFLDDAGLERVAALAGGSVVVDQRIVSYYVGRLRGAPVGVAYFDAHRVRTMREVAMIVVGPGGAVDRVEILSFLEPPEYMASDAWMAQLTDRVLDGELAIGRGIINMTGATLTADALTEATRRVLALHAVIDPLGGVEAESGS